jgi:putative membrane protein
MKALLAAASVCALLVAVPAWAQNAGAQGTTETQATGGQAMATAAGLSQQDQTFVKEAGAGSLAEADAGRLAMERGGTPAIREFGRWMYTDHGIVANNWLKAIMAAEHQPFQPTPTAEQQQMQQRLERLSGRQFDREYTQAQVTDHEKTMPIFQTEARDGQNPMIKNFAQSMIPVLQEHLAEAKILAGETGVAGQATGESTGSSTQR